MHSRPVGALCSVLAGDRPSHKGFGVLLFGLAQPLEKTMDIVARFCGQLGSRFPHFLDNRVRIHNLHLLLCTEHVLQEHRMRGALGLVLHLSLVLGFIACALLRELGSLEIAVYGVKEFLKVLRSEEMEP